MRPIPAPSRVIRMQWMRLSRLVDAASSASAASSCGKTADILQVAAYRLADASQTTFNALSESIYSSSISREGGSCSLRQWFFRWDVGICETLPSDTSRAN